MKTRVLEIPEPDRQRIAQRGRLDDGQGGYVRNEIVDAERGDMTSEEYHSKHARGTVSRSELDLFAKNPSKYREEILLRNQPRKITDDMRIGQCLHMELLSGHQKPVRVADSARPNSPLAADNRRQGARWQKFVEEVGPYYVLPGEAESFEGMVSAVRRNEAVAEFLHEGGRFNTKHESTILARHEPTGLKTRCRYDIESVWLWDLKKTQNASAQHFANHVVDFGYHCQGAFYQDHLAALQAERTPRSFILIAVQDSGDHRVECYELSERFLQIGRVLNAHRLDLFAMYWRTWEIMNEIAKDNDTRVNPDDLWTSSTEGIVRSLEPPSKAIFQMEWEADLVQAHEELKKRLLLFEQKMKKGTKADG